MQPTGRSDPYVIVTCGESSHSTEWKLQTLDPTWNETFLLWLPAPSAGAPPPRLSFRVRDKDFLSSDDDLGLAFVTLDDIEPLKVTEMELQLKGPTAGEGKISVALQVLPFTAEDSGARSRSLQFCGAPTPAASAEYPAG